MRKDIDIAELIENYLKGKLSGEQKIQFEHRLKTDSTFREEVEKHRQIFNLIQEGSLLDIRESLQEIHRHAVSGKSHLFGKNRKIFSVLIIIAGLLLTLLILYKTKKHPTEAIEIPQADTLKNVPLKTETLKTPDPLVHEKTLPHISPTQKHRVEQARELFPKNDSTAQKSTKKILADTVLDKHKSELTSEKIKTTLVSQTKQTEYAPEMTEPTIPETPDCSHINITAQINLEESCFGKPTGSIKIPRLSIEGGEPPYSISIDNGENFHNQYYFEKLLHGYYTVWLQDKNRCKSRLGKFTVGAKDCIYTHVFAPYKEEKWEVPSEGKETMLQIYNLQGKMVHQYRISSGEIYEWDGRSDHDDVLAMGAYSFILEFVQGERMVGTITIVN